MKRFEKLLKVLLGVLLITSAFVLPWRSFHYFATPSYEKLTGQTLTFVVIAGLLLMMCGLCNEKYDSAGKVITLCITVMMTVWLLMCASPNKNNPYSGFNRFESGFYLDIFITVILIISLVTETMLYKNKK